MESALVFSAVGLIWMIAGTVRDNDTGIVIGVLFFILARLWMLDDGR